MQKTKLPHRLNSSFQKSNSTIVKTGATYTPLTNIYMIAPSSV